MYNSLINNYRVMYPSDVELRDYDTETEIKLHLETYLPLLKSSFVDSVTFVHDHVRNPQNHMIIEGANAVMLG